MTSTASTPATLGGLMLLCHPDIAGVGDVVEVIGDDVDVVFFFLISWLEKGYVTIFEVKMWWKHLK